MIKTKNSSGFSLAEMSIVLVIIGSIAASAISIAISSDYTTKRDLTESKLDRIEEALAGYLAVNHRLPCPADGTLATTDANFALERNNGASPPVCNQNFNVSNVWGGVIPVRTLSLPDDFMYDGWGRRIDYVVDYKFAIGDLSTGATCTGTSGNPCFRDMTAGSITVNDASGSAITTTAVYVLLSHGENGHGAFPKPGSATNARINGFPAGNPYRDATASANEFTNAKVDNAGATVTPYTATFVMRDYTRNDDQAAAASARTYFDDQIRFRTKSQIVKAAGYTLYDYQCKDALDIVNGTSTTCTGATDNTQCETFATEINSRCMQ